MGLEANIGNGIWELNPDNPTAGDYRSEGDDHLRGIKQALLSTFPYINGTIRRTGQELNFGSVPAGSGLLFWNEAAPFGWTRHPVLDTYMLRVVPDDEAGGVGTGGGTNNPIWDGKAAEHWHAVVGLSGGEGGDPTGQLLPVLQERTSTGDTTLFSTNINGDDNSGAWEPRYTDVILCNKDVNANP